MKAKSFRFLVATLLTMTALLAGQRAWAQNISVSCSNEGKNTLFTITRSGSLPQQTLRYRTVSLSAFKGQHFENDYSGTLNFKADQASQTVIVKEQVPTGVFQYAVSQSANGYLNYRFEVLDANGFLLTSCDRSCAVTKVNSTNIDKERVKEFLSVNGESDNYEIRDGGYESNPIGDDYVNHHYLDLSSTDFFEAGTQAYLAAIGAELRMTLKMEAHEEQDGYQYIQLLTDNTTTCDAKGNNGVPSNIVLSRYMAGFEMQRGYKDDVFKEYTFPVLSAGDDAGATDPWKHSTETFKTNLIRQKFNKRASDGKIVLNTDFHTLVLRFDASGSDSDTWVAKNVYGIITAVDETAPSLASNGIIVSPGPYNKGNYFYISVAFSEIVQGTAADTKLETTWGDATRYWFSNGNVITFRGTITAEAGTPLKITGLTGTKPKDLFNNEFSGTITHTFSGVTSTNDPHSITAHAATFAGQTHYWTTFFDGACSYRLPAGAQAFTMKEDKALYRVGDGSIIPAGIAVVIMADMETITLTATNETATPETGNILEGVSTFKATKDINTKKKFYVLGVYNGHFGFHQFTGTVVPAYKAYYLQ